MLSACVPASCGDGEVRRAAVGRGGSAGRRREGAQHRDPPGTAPLRLSVRSGTGVPQAAPVRGHAPSYRASPSSSPLHVNALVPRSADEKKGGKPKTSQLLQTAQLPGKTTVLIIPSAGDGHAADTGNSPKCFSFHSN